MTPAAPVVETRRWHAVARCASCDWSAEMTGDTELEVAIFLRALLMEHVNRMHRQ